MSREYREVTQTQTSIMTSAVRCDRCGESARVVGAPPREAWGTLTVLQQGSADVVELDLCRGCSEAVLGFALDHPRAVKRTTRDAMAEMDERERGET